MSVRIARAAHERSQYSPHPLTSTRLATCIAELLLRRPLWGPAEGLPSGHYDANCGSGVNGDCDDGGDDYDDGRGDWRVNPACLSLTVWTKARTKIQLLLKMLSLLLPMPRVPVEEKGIRQVRLTRRGVGLLLALTLSRKAKGVGCLDGESAGEIGRAAFALPVAANAELGGRGSKRRSPRANWL